MCRRVTIWNMHYNISFCPLLVTIAASFMFFFGPCYNSLPSRATMRWSHVLEKNEKQDILCPPEQP